MQLKTAGDIRYYVFHNLSAYPEVVHGVFTRPGGVSKAPYGSLNVGFIAGDDKESVLANRKLMCQSVGVAYRSLVVTRQVHGTDIATITGEPRVKQPEEWYGLLPPSDAMITATHDQYLLMTFADCVPLLFYDPVNHVAGIAHGGWKGTVGKVAERTVEAMSREFNSNPSRLVAAIGPAIGPCCYEVGDDVIAAARQSFGNVEALLVPGPNGSVHFDLWEANRRQLLDAGIPREQVEIASICTACHTDVFFSHRAERGQTGRFGVLIGMR